MLKKLYRLPASQKLRHATFSKTPNFSLRIAKNDLEISRFGFIVKKTVDKRAVIRNRTRRVLRSCIEELLSGISSGHDMLFLLEKGIIGKEREEIYKEIAKILKEKRLLS